MNDKKEIVNLTNHDEGLYKANKNYWKDKENYIKIGFYYYVKISNDGKPLIFTLNGDLIKIFLPPEKLLKNFEKADHLPEDFGTPTFLQKLQEQRTQYKINKTQKKGK